MSSCPAPLFTFEWNHYRYAVHGSMAASPDYRTPLLASCSLASPRGGVFPRWVELLPFRLEELDSQIAERCVFELLRAGKAAHPNLARMGGVVFDERMAYLRMQHLPGPTSTTC